MSGIRIVLGIRMRIFGLSSFSFGAVFTGQLIWSALLFLSLEALIAMLFIRLKTDYKRPSFCISGTLPRLSLLGG